jgi:hypothetical protein
MYIIYPIESPSIEFSSVSKHTAMYCTTVKPLYNVPLYNVTLLIMLARGMSLQTKIAEIAPLYNVHL